MRRLGLPGSGAARRLEDPGACRPAPARLHARGGGPSSLGLAAAHRACHHQGAQEAVMPRLWLGAITGAVALAACTALAAPRFSDFPGNKTANSVEVDVELVLAVDISYSMDRDELALQRDGYIEAINSPEFLNALKGGMHGRVAITYVEWAGASEQRILVPWRLIDGPATAAAVTAEIGRAPIRRAYRTSISGALRFAAPLFDDNGYTGIRRVIDVSGDGTNNQGPLVNVIRDEVVAK